MLERMGSGRWRLNTTTTTGLAATLFLLGIAAVIAIRAIWVFADTTLWVSDTHNMLHELRQWLAQVEVTDSDQLRYFIRRDVEYRQMVEKDQEVLQKEMNDVVILVRNDPSRRAKVLWIKSLTDDESNYMTEKMVEWGRNPQSSDSSWISKSNDMIWKVRVALTDMLDREGAALDVRSQKAQRLGRQVMVVIPATLALSLATLLATILLLNREVAGRIRAEQEVRKANGLLDQRINERTAELRAAINELEGFSYSVAHDLRAPIRAIGGYAGILADTTGDKLSEDARQLLDNIGRQAVRMGRLIDDLLRFSRLSRQPIALTQVDMAKGARGAFEEVAPAGRNIDFRLPALPEIPGDAAMLRQVWVNLLSNAVKFTAGRDPAVIEVGSEVAADEVIYSVKDNGAGFDMRYAGKLFGPFQRLHDEDEFPGTGIGLALVDRIIRRHGGRVWADGKPGSGATFYFALPAQRR